MFLLKWAGLEVLDDDFLVLLLADVLLRLSGLDGGWEPGRDDVCEVDESWEGGREAGSGLESLDIGEVDAGLVGSLWSSASRLSSWSVERKYQAINNWFTDWKQRAHISDGARQKPDAFILMKHVLFRVGYRLNFINSNSDSAYRFRFLSIPSFDSNVVKN